MCIRTYARGLHVEEHWFQFILVHIFHYPSYNRHRRIIKPRSVFCPSLRTSTEGKNSRKTQPRSILIHQFSSSREDLRERRYTFRPDRLPTAGSRIESGALDEHSVACAVSRRCEGDAVAHRRCTSAAGAHRCIAVRSDDRNDSNHLLTSGIRHSGFRVATPAAIVAVYDCRARSPSPSRQRFFSSFPLLLLLLLLPSLLFISIFLPLPARGSGFLVSPQSPLLDLKPFLFPRDVSLRVFLAHLSPYPSHLLSTYLLHISSVSFALARLFTLPPARSPRPLLSSRRSALNPTRYRPHSPAQRRDRDICICIRVCTVRHRRRRRCNREVARSDSVAPNSWKVIIAIYIYSICV